MDLIKAELERKKKEREANSSGTWLNAWGVMD